MKRVAYIVLVSVILSACSTEGRLEMTLDGIVEDGTLNGKQVYAVLTGAERGMPNQEQLFASQVAEKAAKICPQSYTVVGKYKPRNYSSIESNGFSRRHVSGTKQAVRIVCS